MGVKVATTCFRWSQPIVPHSPPSSQTIASAISSASSKRRCRSDGAGTLGWRYVNRLDRSALFGNPTKLHRTWSYEYAKSRTNNIRRACSANFNAFSDEEFSKKIEALALRFQLSGDDDNSRNNMDSESKLLSDCRDNHGENSADRCNHLSEEECLNLVQNQRISRLDSVEPPWPEVQQEPPDWSARDDIIPASIERKANSVDIPLSLRIIKRKLRWQEGFREAGESAYCSVKAAFSSMVFIIRELHSYTLQMREFLFTEDLQGILVRVQNEIHASFVWLFQQVFSHTPTLMVYVMILLANFTVYSMGNNVAIAASPPPSSYPATTETVQSAIEIQEQKNPKFDSSSIKTFSVSSSSGKSAFVGGDNGGGGNIRPVSSGTDGDGWFDRTDEFKTAIPAHTSSTGTIGEAGSVSGQVTREEELSLWNSIVEEARQMQASVRDESLDHETMQRFVSPFIAKIEPDDHAVYFRTELIYQTELSQESNNPLMLANYAQFLYLVTHDYDRAEKYFKKAVGAEPPDAEAYSKYAHFLWRVRKDLWAAEEAFLEAISADPTNSYYAANYAHFLWNTGGEDTCFPLGSSDNTQQV